MTDTPTLGQLVLSKLGRVIGHERSEQELSLVLAQLQLTSIDSVDDLERVAEALQRRPGFVATVGAMLSVDVAMRRLRAS
ncbi:MAG: hypothetical protein EOO75_13985 [Myxococcales bacterium]|nr:MAG: hypothetical protein EOO75_13985 [Myxococcales bacterium]